MKSFKDIANHSSKQLGLAGLLLSSLVVANSALAAPIELVANGGFETGTLASWSTSGIAGSGPCPTANQDWNVSSVGTATQCNQVANPAGSTYAAYVMNDGTGPLTYQLFQSIFVPLGTTGGALSFDWSSNNLFDAGRTLSVVLNGNTVFTSSTIGDFNLGWVSVATDVSALLAAAAGSSITLQFDNFIPATWTGPAGLGLDNVSVQAQVPEPGVLGLFGAALLGAAFARKRKQA
jgi:hypothetical protein